jgi:surface polysaccharide O-acyltransferase-like enzyme
LRSCIVFWLFSESDQKFGSPISSSSCSSLARFAGASKIAPHSLSLLAERGVLAFEFVEGHTNYQDTVLTLRPPPAILRSMATAERVAVPVQAPGREYGLDWLRVLAFAILIFYHSGMMFVSWGWHIENADKSKLLEYVMLFFNRWRLALLFFISGAGVWFSLRRRTPIQFVGERIVRLLVPLAFAMLVIVPPQIYFERLFRGQEFDSYFAFWRTVFDGVPYPKGNTSWHHMWFVAYILVYSVAGLPLLLLLRAQPGQRLIDALSRALRWRPALYAIAIPSLIVGLTLGPRWPTTHNLIADWANLTGMFVIFLWGFVLCSRREFLDMFAARRRELLAGALLMTVLFYALPGGGPREVVSGYMGFLWVLTLVGMARAHWNRDSALLRYATEAVYPFYIVHQTITVAAGYYIVRLPWPVLPKLALSIIVTFAGSWLVYELVKRTAVTRLLFGLKLKPAAPQVGVRHPKL